MRTRESTESFGMFAGIVERKAASRAAQPVLQGCVAELRLTAPRPSLPLHPTQQEQGRVERRETRQRVLSGSARHSALAPFAIKSYRLQWPSDLLTSWAFEVENLVLGWYILTETGSVLPVTLLALLDY